jgi:Transposase DDE domain
VKKEDFIRLMDAAGISPETMENIAISNELVVRKSAIGPAELLHSFCMACGKGTASFNDVAAAMEAGLPQAPSRQAVAKRMAKPAWIYFLDKLLALLLAGKFDLRNTETIRKCGSFSRVLVQDSTVIRLPKRLFPEFSGVANGSVSVCNARVQCVYDLMAEAFTDFSIDPYSKNDTKAAPELDLRPGDLVLRDRGYFGVAEFRRHRDAGAHCVYRYKHGTIFNDPLTGQRFDLLTALKLKGSADCEVALNDDKATIVRIMAAPVSEELANTRRMKAKKESKHTPSAECLELMAWSIFITTIPKQEAGFECILQIYSLRWRIETIFKSWKGEVAFAKIHNVSHQQLNAILRARFIMIVLCSQYIFSPARKIIAEHGKNLLSLLKVIRYLMADPSRIAKTIIEINEYDRILKPALKALKRYCSYEKRKRKSFEQVIETVIWP